jgi:ribosomal protein S18 acetylase RimI-like enzyme
MSLGTSRDTSRTPVRVIGADDWPVWRSIRLRALRDSPSAFGSTYTRELAFTEDDWVRRLTSGDSVSVLAEDGDGRPVGMGGGYPDLPGFVHVVAMWVDPAVRERGVGRPVLGGIERWAGERGLRLHLDVNTTNVGARRCYEHYGFTATGETRPLREASADLVERMVLASPARPDPSPTARHAAQTAE